MSKHSTIPPPSITTVKRSKAAAPPPNSTNPNLTTTLYHTHLGLFALTWSKNLFSRSFHLHLPLENSDDSLSSPSFHLHIKPFIFWKKHGSKKLTHTKNTRIYWDLSKAKFGPGPEPQSGFYIAVVIDGEMTLLAGDSPKQAYAKTKANESRNPQVMVLKREHIHGQTKQYSTYATHGGKTRHISIDCKIGDEPRLTFSLDNKRVLQIKHLKWKFRGNERIEVDGVQVQISWDVHNWLFDQNDNEVDGYVLFMFKFEKLGFQEYREDDLVLWSQQQACGLGFEAKKMKKGLLRTAARTSSSSSSLSSASSGCSSVMEWESMEENELKGPSGFSLLVYAWKN